MITRVQRMALIAKMDAAIAAKAAIVAEAAAKAALKAADAAALQSRIATRLARSTRIRAGQFITFSQATPEQQEAIRRLFVIKYWDCPNGSSGREVSLRRVCDDSMHWEQGINWSRLYVCIDDDIIFVDLTRKKVNATVDFGIHFYQGDREYIDIKIADLEVSK